MDGCSAECTIEPGFDCTSLDCTTLSGFCALRVPAVFRDFNAHDEPGGHPDFQPGYNSEVIQGLLSPVLDAVGKPTLAGGASIALGFLHGAAEFAQWYRDAPGVNATIRGEVVLWDDGTGRYVNRWGANGESWETLGTPYEGNPLFFPVDAIEGALEGNRYPAKVPEQYGWNGWAWEADVATSLGVSTPIPTATAPFPSDTHNFAFTSELRYEFRYDASTPIVLEITGDDDIWVFLNGRLVIDIGGWHVPLPGAATIAGGFVTTTAPNVGAPIPVETLGLVDGGVYEITILHAERERDGSTFRLVFSGIDVAGTSCLPRE